PRYMLQHFTLDWFGHGPARFIIHAHHLLRMALLSTADVALLDRGWPARVGHKTGRVDSQISQQFLNPSRIRILAHHTGYAYACPQRPQHRGHTARPAQPLFSAIRAQEGNGRLLADAFGITPDVAVEHHVADDQNARLPQVLHQLNEIRSHDDSPEVSAACGFSITPPTAGQSEQCRRVSLPRPHAVVGSGLRDGPRAQSPPPRGERARSLLFGSVIPCRHSPSPVHQEDGRNCEPPPPP